LDAIVDYMPSPVDVPAIKGVTPDGKDDVRKSADEEPFAGLAFKIATDPFVGRLCFFRVYSGTIQAGSYVYNSTKDKKERAGRIVRMHANKRIHFAIRPSQSFWKVCNLPNPLFNLPLNLKPKMTKKNLSWH